MLEEHRITELTTCGDRGLSVIECLLIGRDCSASTFTGSLCIRYLGGLLNLPGFWLDMGTLHAHVAKKLCCEMVQVLKDIGVDILALGPLDESEAPFDYEGVDFLATAVLTGISSWFGRLEEANWSLQPWYDSFAGFLRLLRMPRATELLPHSSATATTSATLEDILPTVNRDARLNVFIDGDNETEHNQHRANNISLVDLRSKNNSVGSIGSHISNQDNTTHSLGSLQEDNDDAQSQDSDMDTAHRTGQKDVNNSSSTSDDESYDCSRQCIDDCDDDVPGFEFGLSHGPGSDLIQDTGAPIGQISGAQSVPNATPYPSLEARRKAAEEWKVALDQRQRDFGEDHPDTIYAMDYLAYSHMELGEYTAARDLWVMVYKKRRILQGEEDHPDTLRTMGNLAETCRRLGQFKKAEELEIVLLEKRRQLLGEDHPDTLLTASNLAATYRGLGHFKEAESLHVQVLEKRKEILGEDHPDTLLAMEILAATYLGLGQLKEAESLRIQVLEKWRRILGEDHPDTLKTMCNLAATYLHLGKPKAAEELGVVALEKQSKLLGEDHPHILVTMANLAVAYYQQGQFEHAEELYIAILQKRRKILGNDHPDTIEAMRDLATTYRSLGKLQDAEELEALLGDREV
ncbi:hypothetical protein FB451DRAFT_1129691 [Mycena latifolia]|nr:hypothetical protein FB451DRAFT_1129691 [Mycena latifolia]